MSGFTLETWFLVFSGIDGLPRRKKRENFPAHPPVESEEEKIQWPPTTKTFKHNVPLERNQIGREGDPIREMGSTKRHGDLVRNATSGFRVGSIIARSTIGGWFARVCRPVRRLVFVRFVSPRRLVADAAGGRELLGVGHVLHGDKSTEE